MPPDTRTHELVQKLEAKQAELYIVLNSSSDLEAKLAASDEQSVVHRASCVFDF